jgi:hypothetical protein
MKTARILLTLITLAALPGCGYLVGTYNDVSAWTSRQWSSEKAWRARKWMYADMPCRGSFKSGFKAGYRFANGGYDSCEPPQLRHYWRIGNLTESERENAQAWSDGFTHGTLAAQQDHAVGTSAFEMAAMQPPAGVPDVRYYNPPQMNEMSEGAQMPYSPYPESAPQSQGPPPGYQFPPTASESAPNAGNPSYAPANAPNLQYSPPPVPPAPASEAMPTRTSRPSFVAPPPAPASLPTTDVQIVPNAMTLSEAAPGVGNRPVSGTFPPAPAAEPGPESYPRQGMSLMPPQATQTADWELPLIRN